MTWVWYWITNLGRAAFAPEGAAEVIDDDAGATGSEEESISLSEATSRTGYDNHLIVESQLFSHGLRRMLDAAGGDVMDI